jgi:hypothetical protein
MTFAESVYRFLQVDHLVCANCGKKLSPVKGYRKLAMWPQYAFFTWRWFKQTWFGNNQVLRFCLPTKDSDCFVEFAAKGRLTEIERK